MKRQDAQVHVAVTQEDGQLTIQIRDQGTSITSEHLEKIFEEFYSTKPMGEGTGLGSAISHDIMTNFFGGTISVTSVIGHGSTFTLQLPLDKTHRHDSAFPVEYTALAD